MSVATRLLPSSNRVCREQKTGEVDASEANTRGSSRAGVQSRARPSGEPGQFLILCKELASGTSSEKYISHVCLQANLIRSNKVRSAEAGKNGVLAGDSRSFSRPLHGR
jgi:hypothetical protein